MPTPLFNKTVLMSDALNFSADKTINPYYGDKHIDQAKAIAEHSAIKSALESAGITVHTTPSPRNSQDGVYTANWALVRGDTAVLARLPEARKTEESYAQAVLEALGKHVVYVPDGLKFSGQGDALPCGNYLLCGKGYRSDEAAQQFAAETLGYTRIQLEAVPQLDENGTPVINNVSGWPDSFFYDIDLAISIIRPPTDSAPGIVAYCPDALTKESVDALRTMNNVDLLPISLQEAQQGFAANLVSTGEVVVMSKDAPQFKAALEARGLTVVTPSISELAKGGGYIRCTTLTID